MLDLAKNDLIEVLNNYKQNDAESPIALSEGDWTIAEGGYDCWFEIYHGQNCTPVAECVAGKISVYGFTDAENKEIKKIILRVLDYLK